MVRTATKAAAQPPLSVLRFERPENGDYPLLGDYLAHPHKPIAYQVLASIIHPERVVLSCERLPRNTAVTRAWQQGRNLWKITGRRVQKNGTRT